MSGVVNDSVTFEAALHRGVGTPSDVVADVDPEAKELVLRLDWGHIRLPLEQVARMAVGVVCTCESDFEACTHCWTQARSLEGKRVRIRDDGYSRLPAGTVVTVDEVDVKDGFPVFVVGDTWVRPIEVEPLDDEEVND